MKRDRKRHWGQRSLSEHSEFYGQKSSKLLSVSYHVNRSQHYAGLGSCFEEGVGVIVATDEHNSPLKSRITHIGQSKFHSIPNSSVILITKWLLG